VFFLRGSLKGLPSKGFWFSSFQIWKQVYRFLLFFQNIGIKFVVELSQQRTVSLLTRFDEAGFKIIPFRANGLLAFLLILAVFLCLFSILDFLLEWFPFHILILSLVLIIFRNSRSIKVVQIVRFWTSEIAEHRYFYFPDLFFRNPCFRWNTLINWENFIDEVF
jgi:hypothetical protein